MAISDCKALGPDYATLKAEFTNALAIFHAGWLHGLVLVGEKLLIDRTNVIGHVKNIVGDYQSQNYAGIGNEIGQILKELLDESQKDTRVMTELDFRLLTNSTH